MDEKQRLKKMRESGTSWDKIAETFPDRTREALASCWKVSRTMVSVINLSTYIPQKMKRAELSNEVLKPRVRSSILIKFIAAGPWCCQRSTSFSKPQPARASFSREKENHDGTTNQNEMAPRYETSGPCSLPKESRGYGSIKYQTWP